MSTIDIIIVAAFIIFIVWWAMRHGKSSDSQSYFLAARNMKWWVIGLSLFAASISSSTLIGNSGDAYATGIAVFNYNLVSVVVMVFFAWFFLPFYIKSGIFTMPEFLGRRFDQRSRYYFSFICIVGNVFLDAAGALYAAALILKLLLPEVDMMLIITVFALIAALITIPGGLSSAINAELIQAVVLILGSIVLTILCANAGGAEYLREVIANGDIVTKLVRPMDDLSVPWLGMIVGIPILGFYFWGNNQTLVQRVLAAKNVDEGRKGVLFNGFLTLLTLFFIILPGVMALRLFPGLEKPDMVYPTMILELMPVGLLGLMIAVLLAALTSTLSAILNSAATLFTMDFYTKFRPNTSTEQLVTVGRIVSIVILVIAVLWAPNIGKFGSLVKYYQEMLSYISPPIVAAFFLGLFSKRVNGTGVFIGFMVGLVTAIVMLFFRTAIFGDMHFLLVVPFLLIGSILIMVIASRFFEKPSEEVLKEYTWSSQEFREETVALKSVKWYANYRIWSYILLACCALILLVFR